MEKLQANKDSALARWFRFNYDDLPKTTCQFFWWLLGTLILTPFSIIIFIGNKLIPAKIRVPERKRFFHNLPIIAKGFLGFIFALCVVGVTLAIVSDIEGAVWWRVGLTSIVTFYLCFVFFAYCAKREHENGYVFFKPAEEGGKTGSVKLFFQSIYDGLHKMCKPIDWT